MFWLFKPICSVKDLRKNFTWVQGCTIKRLRPKKQKSFETLYSGERNVFSLCEVCLCIYFVWMKEGPRMCWVVSGPGKSLGWMFLFPQVSEMPNTIGIIYVSGTLWHVWGKNFFVSTGIWDVKYPWNNFPQNTSATLGERFGFSNLFAASRIFGRVVYWFEGAPQQNTQPQKPDRKTLRIASGDNYRKYHKELGRVCNQYFNG